MQTEEEFQIEKSKLVQEQKNKILEYYSKKENQIKMAKHMWVLLIPSKTY